MESDYDPLVRTLTTVAEDDDLVPWCPDGDHGTCKAYLAHVISVDEEDSSEEGAEDPTIHSSYPILYMRENGVESSECVEGETKVSFVSCSPDVRAGKYFNTVNDFVNENDVSDVLAKMCYCEGQVIDRDDNGNINNVRTCEEACDCSVNISDVISEDVEEVRLISASSAAEAYNSPQFAASPAQPLHGSAGHPDDGDDIRRQAGYLGHHVNIPWSCVTHDISEVPQTISKAFSDVKSTDEVVFRKQAGGQDGIFCLAGEDQTQGMPPSEALLEKSCNVDDEDDSSSGWASSSALTVEEDMTPTTGDRVPELTSDCERAAHEDKNVDSDIKPDFNENTELILDDPVYKAVRLCCGSTSDLNDLEHEGADVIIEDLGDGESCQKCVDDMAQSESNESKSEEGGKLKQYIIQLLQESEFGDTKEDIMRGEVNKDMDEQMNISIKMSVEVPESHLEAEELFKVDNPQEKTKDLPENEDVQLMVKDEMIMVCSVENEIQYKHSINTEGSQPSYSINNEDLVPNVDDEYPLDKAPGAGRMESHNDNDVISDISGPTNICTVSTHGDECSDTVCVAEAVFGKEFWIKESDKVCVEDQRTEDVIILEEGVGTQDLGELIEENECSFYAVVTEASDVKGDASLTSECHHENCVESLPHSHHLQHCESLYEGTSQAVITDPVEISPGDESTLESVNLCDSEAGESESKVEDHIDLDLLPQSDIKLSSESADRCLGVSWHSSSQCVCHPSRENSVEIRVPEAESLDADFLNSDGANSKNAFGVANFKEVQTEESPVYVEEVVCGVYVSSADAADTTSEEDQQDRGALESASVTVDETTVPRGDYVDEAPDCTLSEDKNHREHNLEEKNCYTRVREEIAKEVEDEDASVQDVDASVEGEDTNLALKEQINEVPLENEGGREESAIESKKGNKERPPVTTEDPDSSPNLLLTSPVDTDSGSDTESLFIHACCEGGASSRSQESTTSPPEETEEYFDNQYDHDCEGGSCGDNGVVVVGDVCDGGTDNFTSVHCDNLLVLSEEECARVIVTSEYIPACDELGDEEQVDVVEEQVDVTEEQVDVTEEQVDVTEEQVDVVEEQVDVTEEQVDVTEEQVDVTEEQVDVVEEQVDVTEEQVDVTEEQVDVTEEQVDVTEEQVDVVEEQVDVEKQVDVVEEQVDVVEQVDVTEEQVDVTEEQVDVTEEQVDVTEEQVDVVEEQVDVTEEQVDVTEEQVDVTEEQVDVTEEQVDVTEEQVDVTEEQVDVTEEQVDVVEEQVDVVEEQVDVVEEQVDVVEEQVDVVEEQVDVVEEQVDVVEDQVDVTEEQVDVTEEQVDVTEEQVDVTEEQVDVVEEQVDVTEEQVDVTEEQVDVTEEQVDVTEEQVNVTEEQVDVTEEQVDVTEEQVDVVEEQADVTEEQVDVTEEQVDVTEEQVDVTEEQVDVTEEQVDVTEEQVDVTEEQVDVTEEQVDVTEKEIAATEEQIGGSAEEHAEETEEQNLVSIEEGCVHLARERQNKRNQQSDSEQNNITTEEHGDSTIEELYEEQSNVSVRTSVDPVGEQSFAEREKHCIKITEEQSGEGVESEQSVSGEIEQSENTVTVEQCSAVMRVMDAAKERTVDVERTSDDGSVVESSESARTSKSFKSESSNRDSG
ncbi:hypothetical protein OTU49_015330, partial [Cherax quadricarinatus]